MYPNTSNATKRSCGSISAIRPRSDEGKLLTTEIDAFINTRSLITVRKDEDFSMDRVMSRWDRSPDLAANGVSFLLYGLLDVVVDGYFGTVQHFDEFYDKVSEDLFAEKPLPPSEQQQWFQTRQALMKFRRIVVPMRETMTGLMRRDQSAVAEAMYAYYEDVYDHVLRVNESTDALRDLISTLAETNLSLRDYRSNQIMKLVTSWAAIIAVPTLITGWYGVNVPYPGSGETWGVWAAAALVVILSGALYLIFRRRNWLSREESERFFQTCRCRGVAFVVGVTDRQRAVRHNKGETNDPVPAFRARGLRGRTRQAG